MADLQKRSSSFTTAIYIAAAIMTIVSGFIVLAEYFDNSSKPSPSTNEPIIAGGRPAAKPTIVGQPGNEEQPKATPSPHQHAPQSDSNFVGERKPVESTTFPGWNTKLPMPTVDANTHSTHPLIDVLRIVPLAAPDTADEEFPISILRRELGEKLGGTTTEVREITLEVAFVAPRELRSRVRVSTGLFGYIVVRMSAETTCQRVFGPPRDYEYGTVDGNMRKAIEDNSFAITDWIRKYSDSGGKSCTSE